LLLDEKERKGAFFREKKKGKKGRDVPVAKEVALLSAQKKEKTRKKKINPHSRRGEKESISEQKKGEKGRRKLNVGKKKKHGYARKDNHKHITSIDNKKKKRWLLTGGGGGEGGGGAGGGGEGGGGGGGWGRGEIPNRRKRGGVLKKGKK